MKNGINVSVKMNNWISIEDQLPPDGQEVLLFFKHRIGESRIIVGYSLDNEWNYCAIFQSYAFDFFGVKVTHWMELPECPE